jgi:DNA replication protein DnaC
MGKSHLAAAAIHEALNAGWTNCYFRVWPEYLRRLQVSWNRPKDDNGEWIGESEADITEEFQKGRLIVIDDLDKRQPTDWSRSVLYTALNHRYNAQLPTILTFNFGPDHVDPKAPGRMALENYLGGAIFDRLLQSVFDVIEFNGPSYRSGVTLKP